VIDEDLVDLLLCAADLARQGYAMPITEAQERLGPPDGAVIALCLDARCEAMAVAPRVFEYRGDLLADTLLEAAYRVAEGRGASAVPE
jgi:hypothetical protein